jgi:hypothetical protein
VETDGAETDRRTRAEAGDPVEVPASPEGHVRAPPYGVRPTAP